MKSNKKIAFVLGGGSIKGAYQIGQMYYLIEHGIIPDIMVGISVGSLNSLLYANNLSKYKSHKLAIDKSIDFWKKKIKKPSDVIKKRSLIRVGIDVATNNFKSLYSTKPLENKIRKNISINSLRNSLLDIYVGAVDIDFGKIIYANKFDPKIIDYAIASTRIPFFMPLSRIDNKFFYDGGLIDNAGVGKAIELGADEIYVLATHPKKITNPLRKKGNIKELINRVMEIVVNNTLDNDIKLAELYNSMSDDYLKSINKKKVDMKVIRPFSMINIDISNFDSKNINEMILSGYRDAKIFFNGL